MDTHCTAPLHRAASWFLGLALLATTLAPPAAQAQWTWRDKSGQVNASDRPPPRDVLDKDILSRPNASANANARRSTPAATAPAASGAALGAAVGAAPGAAQGSAASEPTALEKEVQARKRIADQEQASKAKAEEDRSAAARAENCRSARSHLASLETGQRIARTNDKGEREVLDDAGRATELRRAREVIASDCR